MLKNNDTRLDNMIAKILQNIQDGKYKRKELENLYKNAIKKDIVSIQQAVQKAFYNFGMLNLRVQN